MKKKNEKGPSRVMDRRTFLKASSAIGVGATAIGSPGINSTPQKYSGEKIDFFCHILPPKYNEALVNQKFFLK